MLLRDHTAPSVVAGHLQAILALIGARDIAALQLS